MGHFANLREYNHYHDARGRFTTASGVGKWAPGNKPVSTYKRPKPIAVTSVDEALTLVLQGKVVELPDPKQVNTLLNKLAEIAQEAKAKGQEAPEYDLCNVTAKNARNLFCAESVRTSKNPEGISRIKMPQFSGKARPGSEASKLPINPIHGGVDGSEAFLEHMRSLGIQTSRMRVPAARLKASQRELVGPKVAEIMTQTKWDPAEAPIFVSRDHYVIDGHHRWAAVVGRDLEDGRPGDLMMNTIMVDAPITEVLHLANKWAKSFGILPSKGPKKARRRRAA